MNIVQPYARIMNLPERSDEAPAGIDLLTKIEWCGRISHRSEEAQTEDSWRRFIQAVVLGHGDWSIVEHASVTVDALVDRGISHEWVRHRLFSFTQQSTRFVNHAKKIPPEFILPETGNAYPYWLDAIEHAEQAYLNMLNAGATPQIARSVFPNALATRIVTTGNLRAWRHFLLMRTTKESHPQMREVTISLLAEFQDKIPLLFDDIIPGESQAKNLRLPR
jgi:thymidylate synthase (FAD)